MDGTLVNSKKNITNSINHTRDMLGLDAISEDMVYKYINIPNENLALRFYHEETFTKETREIFYEHYIDECVKDLHIYEGVKELLEFMDGKVKMAIATNAYDVFAKKMMESVNLSRYFDLIVGANSANASKPDPKMAQFVLDKLQVKAQNSILIGDSKKDELCAKAAKTHFIFASWGYGDYKGEPKFRCDSPLDLKDMIVSILNM